MLKAKKKKKKKGGWRAAKPRKSIRGQGRNAVNAGRGGGLRCWLRVDRGGKQLGGKAHPVRISVAGIAMGANS